MKGWLDKKTREDYVINFGWEQLTFDLATTLIEIVWKTVMTAIYLMLLAIYWPSKLTVLLIEYIFGLALHQREFFWRKRAWFKMELIIEQIQRREDKVAKK